MIIFVNYCGEEELTKISGVGKDLAERIIILRSEGTVITQTLLEAVARRRFTPLDLKHIDFMPNYVGSSPFSLAPKSRSTSFPGSSTDMHLRMPGKTDDPSQSASYMEVPKTPRKEVSAKTPTIEDIYKMQAEIEESLYNYVDDHYGAKPKIRPAFPATFSDSDSSTQSEPQVHNKLPVCHKKPYKEAASMVEGGIPTKDVLNKPAGISLAKKQPNEIYMEALAQLPQVPTHAVTDNQVHSSSTTTDQIKQIQEDIDRKIRQIRTLEMFYKDARATDRKSDSDSSSAQHKPSHSRTNTGMGASQVRPLRHVDSDSTDSENNQLARFRTNSGPSVAKVRQSGNVNSESTDSDENTQVKHKRFTKSSKPGIPALRNLPKTLIFNGKSNWLAFKLKFSRYAEVSQWTQDECRDCLLHCLTDQALTYGAMLLRRDTAMPYRKMMRKLEKRFGAEELPAAAHSKFYQATQKKGESIEEWADRVQTMAAEAFREVPEKYSNEQVIARFCQGLSDIEAGHSVFMRSFSTIEDAMNEVKLYQHAKQAMGRPKRTSQSVTATDYEDPPVQVSAVQARETPAVSNIESILAKLQLELTEVKEQLNNRSSFRGRGRGGNLGRG